MGIGLHQSSGLIGWKSAELVQRDSCPVCRTAPHGEVMTRRHDGLGIRECAECGLLYLDPVPNDAALERCYDADYFNGRSHEQFGIGYETPRVHKGLANFCAEPLGYAEIVENFEIEGRSILEIGCANGALLACFREFRPARLVGVDIAHDAIERGQRRYGLDLRCGTDSVLAPEEKFDLVLMIDVIEHVRDIRGFFSKASVRVKPGGAIFLTTPNASAYRIARQNWPYLNRALEHVSYPSARAIAYLAGLNGMTLDRTWTDGLPVALAQYRYGASHVAARFIREPSTALSNGWRRLRYREAATHGRGLELRAIVRRNARRPEQARA